MPPIERKEIRTPRSRAQLDGVEALERKHLYFLASLGLVLFLGGGAILWSWLVQGAVEGLRGFLSGPNAFFGLALMVSGVACWVPLRVRSSRPGPPLATMPAPAPWQADHPWDTSGIDSDLDDVSWFRAAWHLVATAFLIPLLFSENLGPRLLGLPVALYLGYLWAKALYRLLRRTKFGPSRLRFARCPFPVGGELVAYLPDLDRLKGARNVTATLRFVAEENEWRKAPQGQRKVWVRYCTFEEVRTFQPRDLPFGTGEPARLVRFYRRPDPEAELPLRFELPENPTLLDSRPKKEQLFETRLGTNPPRYWELEVKADLPGIDYLAPFVLPVYPAR
jgi:hypothetical protein